MSGRSIFVLITVFLPFYINCELIKTDMVNIDKAYKFKVKRNIFGFQKTNIPIEPRNKIIEKKEEIAIEEKETKIIATVFYEGFLLKGKQVYALLNVNNKFYVSREGDIIPDNIVVKRIMEKSVILEIESSEVTVLKKGERNVN